MSNETRSSVAFKFEDFQGEAWSTLCKQLTANRWYPIIDVDRWDLLAESSTRLRFEVCYVLDPRIRVVVDLTAIQALFVVGWLVIYSDPPRETLEALLAMASKIEPPDVEADFAMLARTVRPGA